MPLPKGTPIMINAGWHQVVADEGAPLLDPSSARPTFWLTCS
jgi:hypothetical protein